MSGEYIEDPKNMIARNELGKIPRMKLKISLSFKGSGDPNKSILKNVHV